jgi:tryptophanyl-tRNA synthetase
MSQVAPIDRKPRKRALTGITPSGLIHIGNYLGAILPAIKLQEQYDCLYFISDLHALTKGPTPEALRSQTYDIIAAWIASGFDYKRNCIYRQSDLGFVTEFSWFLSCVTGNGLLEKGHAYKDALAQEKDPTHGLFSYPVLMAADIIMYDVDIVPVGKDQKQHVEMARDMAGSFNAKYGEGVLKLPEPLIDERVMTIPGLDGRKMSKSYNNTIPLFSPEKELRRLIMSIKTDSTPLESPKELAGTLVGQLYELFAAKEQHADLTHRLLKGGMGWGHAKEELFNVVNEQLKGPRAIFDQVRPDLDNLEKILKEGRERAFSLAEPVLNRARKAVGFGNFCLSLTR